MPFVPATAITRRFLGFVSEVIGCRPVSRTLRVLVVRPAHPTPNAGCEFAVVFFAPGVKGVAIALWATDRPSGASMPTVLLKVLEGSAEKFREVTVSEEINAALTALQCALEAELCGKPKIALMLSSAFAGAAFDLAAAATATARMPLSGNSSLANYLATFPIDYEDPATAGGGLLQVKDANWLRSKSSVHQTAVSLHCARPAKAAAAASSSAFAASLSSKASNTAAAPRKR
jgi:hypothetical protein